MKKSLLTLLLLPIYATMYSQVLVKQWDYTYGGTDNDFFRTLYVSPGGSIFLYGYSDSGIGADKNSTRGGSDYWLIKLDAAGHLLWEKVYGGSGPDLVTTMIPSKDGNLFLLGGSGSGISGDKSEPGRGNWDYWVLKIDSDGNKLWDRTIGGNGPDMAFGICTTANGGCILGGYSTSDISGDKTEVPLDPTHFYDDYWAVKLDADGNKIWDHVYGGVENDIMSVAIETQDGGAIIGGLSGSSAGGNKTPPVYGSTDFWIIKIDSAGNKMWDKSYGGSGSDNLHSIIQLHDGNFLLTGYSSSLPGGNKTALSKGAEDYWIVKIDTSGNKLWDHSYGGNEKESLESAVELEDGGFLLSGFSSTYAADGDKTEQNLSLDLSQTWILRLDSSGNKVWDKTILSTKGNYGNAVPVGGGCYIVGAVTNSGLGGHKSQASKGGDDYWVIKFCEQPVGIEEITDKVQIQVYPNPTVDDISISIQQINLQSATFTITNNVGQVIYHRQEKGLADSYTKMLDLRNLPNGSYFITVETRGERIVKQVVKQ